MELSLGARLKAMAKVERAYLAALNGHETKSTFEPWKKEDRKALEKFLRCWNELSVGQRAAINAQATSYSVRDAKSRVDVGEAVVRAIGERPKGRTGKKKRQAGFEEATLEAVRIWMELNPERAPEIGSFDSGVNKRSPLLKFVEDLVVLALPEEVVRKQAEIAPGRTWDEWTAGRVTVAVHSMLRRLRECGHF